MKKKKSFLDVLLENIPQLKGFPENDLTRCFCVDKYFNCEHNCSDTETGCANCWKKACDAEFLPYSFDPDDNNNQVNRYLRVHGTPAETDTQISEVPEMSENKIVPDGGNVPDDYAKAVQVNAQIMASAQAAQENLYQMAMGFKKMRDEKLFKALGYDNFGDYCEKETGMVSRNVYRYIEVVEKLPSNFVTSMSQIGIAKLQLLTTISDEQREKITENTDLENTSVKDLREQIKTLKDENERKDAELESSKKAVEEANKRAELAEFHEKQSHESFDRVANQSEKNFEKYNDERRKNDELEKRIKELESRPVDVATKEVIVPDPADKERISALEKQLEQSKTSHDGMRPEQLVKDFYETLHGTALSALQECANFAEKPENSAAAGYMAERFKSLIAVINMHLEDLGV